MKVSELRIGNLVSGGIVIKIENNNVRVSDNYTEWDSICMSKGWLSGIPLTEEWLVKFGFNKQGNVFNINSYYCSFDADHPVWFGEEGCCMQHTIKENIKYVHQLQNLYFALTNEEITIK